MAVRIGRGSKTRWRARHLQFRIESKADRDAVTSAFEDIATALLDIEADDDPGPKYVSDPVPFPGGLIFWVDSPDASPAVIDQIIESVVDCLDAAGVDGRVSAPEEVPDPPEGPWARVVAVPLAPTAPGQPPKLPTWQIDRAVRWVSAERPDSVWVSSGSSALSLPFDTAASILRDWVAEGRDATLVVDVAGDRRQATIIQPPADDSYTVPSLSLAHFGTSTREDLDGAFTRLVEEGRALANESSWVFATVNREAAVLGPRPTPTWDDEPRAQDSLAALGEGVFDAEPWQVLNECVAEKLPDPLSIGATFDAARRELWLGTIDDWLRAERWGYPRGTAFQRSMRAALGGALLTQDQAWEVARRPAEGPPIDAGAFDLNAVPIVGRESPHPSLGVTPLQLVSLLRDEPYNDDPFSLPDTVRSWLRQLAQRLPNEELPKLRPVAKAVAASTITDDRWVRRILADWLVRTLTPDLFDATGLGTGDALRHLRPLTETIHPLDPCRATLEMLPPLMIRREEAARVELESEAVAVRSVVAASMATEHAATEVDWAQFDDQSNYQVATALFQQWSATADLGEDSAHRVWAAGGVSIATSAFIEAFGHAKRSRPRDAAAWSAAWAVAHEAVDRHVLGGSNRAAAVALLAESDPSRAWDVAIAAARAAEPEYWSVLLRSVSDQLGDDAVEEAWAAARDRMESLHGEAHIAAGLASATVPATLACKLIAVEYARTDPEGGAISEVLWRDLDTLVHRLVNDE